ncbi:hypothetical protein PG989_010345 [Apiospora arundinis]
MDSVERLFRALPEPESVDAILRTRGSPGLNLDEFNAPLRDFARTATTPVDPDHAYLKKVAASTCDYEANFCMKLIELALSKTEIPNDGSAKSKQLQYFRWIGRGRKDSERPFLSATTTSTTASSLDYLAAKPAKEKVCVKCGHGNAFACKGCLLTHGSQHVIFETVYCSKECQVADWPDHKSSCVSLKMIGRAAFLIRDLFIMFQGLNYSDKVTGVLEKSGVLYKFVGTLDKWVYQGKTIIQPLPRELCSSEEAYQACVTEQECFEAYSTFMPIVNYFLAPLCKKIREVKIDTRNVHRPTMMINAETTVHGVLGSHQILRVELHSGEKVVVDLAGAQFGWQEPVSHWEPWADQRIYAQARLKAYGYALFKKFQSRLLDHPDAPGSAKVDKFREKQVGKMLDAIINTIKEKQPDTDGSAVKALKLRGYDQLRSEIMTDARKALDAGYAELQASKTMRMYWKVDEMMGSRQLTETKEQSTQALEKVWLSDAVYQKNKHDPRLLMTIWWQRCQKPDVAKACRRLGLTLVSEEDAGDHREASGPANTTTAGPADVLSQIPGLTVITGDGSSYQLPRNNSPGGSASRKEMLEQIFGGGRRA